MRSDMPNDNLVLVDTSIWIDYFLRRNVLLERTLDFLLDNTQVATAAIILAELIQGARGQKEIEKIKKHFKPLHWIQSTDHHWEVAGELSFQLRQTGKQVNLTDCYIAGLAKSSSASLFSLDKHFSWISKINGCTLFEMTQ